MPRQLSFYQAINEAIDLAMTNDPSVYVMGLGVPDPKGVFGTTLHLQQKHGSNRVMDMPIAENGMTGVAVGSALVGLRPIVVHQRLDFAMLAMDQLANQAAKWHYMFAGQARIPLVVRLVVGRGWGQGPQHSQSLQAWFAHVPGLKVVMPASPVDAKGLLISSIEDDNPVVFIEHRWLHQTWGDVPEGLFRVPLGHARIARAGRDLTIVATSYMVVEALAAADVLEQAGVDVEVVDVRTLRPLDSRTIVDSVRKTGHLIVADTGWKTGGFGGEVVSTVIEEAFEAVKSPPRRVGLVDCPTPTTAALAKYCYPRAADLVAHAGTMLGIQTNHLTQLQDAASIPHDVPDSSFTGPF